MVLSKGQGCNISKLDLSMWLSRNLDNRRTDDEDAAPVSWDGGNSDSSNRHHVSTKAH